MDIYEYLLCLLMDLASETLENCSNSSAYQEDVTELKSLKEEMQDIF